MIKITVLAFFVAMVMVIISILYGLFYCYHHPARIRPFLTRYLSRAVKSSVSIKDLSFSISPLKIVAKGLSVLPGKEQGGFKVNAGSMEILLGFEGSFGERDLVIRSIHINDCDVKLSEGMRLPNISRHVSSSTSDSLQDLFSYIFFKKIRLKNVELINGRVLFRSHAGKTEVNNISVILDEKDILDIRCHINTSLESAGASITADGGLHCRATVKKERDKKMGFFRDAHIWINDLTCRLSKADSLLKGRIAGDVLMGLRYPSLSIKRTSLHIKDAVLISGGKNIDIGAIDLRSASSILYLTKRTFNCPEMHIDSDWLKNMDMAVDVSEKDVSVKIHGSNMGLFKSAAAMGFIPPSWTVTGFDSMDIRGIIPFSSVWHFSCGLDFHNLNFSNRDESVMGDGLHLKAAFKGTFNPARLLVKSSVRMDIPEGEALYGPFYLDFASNCFFARGGVAYSHVRKRASLRNVTLGLKNLLVSDITGKIGLQNRTLSMSVKLSPTPLPPLFKFFALDPFGEMVPGMDKIDLTGLVSGSFTLERRRQGIEIKGRCFVHDGMLRFGSDAFNMKDIRLDLPIWCRFPSRGVTRALSPEIPGRLSFNMTYPPWLPSQALSIPIHSRLNGFYVDSPLRVYIPGGHITIKRLNLKDIFVPRGPSVEICLKVDVKDTGPLLNDVLHIPAKGRITGRLDPVYIKNGNLKSSGKIFVRVFGGEIDISDICCRGIFNGPPVFSLSADIRGLNMSEMTRGTSFGKIEGVLNGHVHGLEIAYGQPQAFDLLLESKRVRGVPQRISIAAVDNIARIGGGQSPFIGLAGTLAGIFKTLPYSKMGIRAVLKNDLFRINGIIKEDNVEYIIKRGGLFGVNIINQNPDNQISFKDMVKRIKRIFSPRHEGGKGR